MAKTTKKNKRALRLTDISNEALEGFLQLLMAEKETRAKDVKVEPTLQEKFTRIKGLNIHTIKAGKKGSVAGAVMTEQVSQKLDDTANKTQRKNI